MIKIGIYHFEKNQKSSVSPKYRTDTIFPDIKLVSFLVLVSFKVINPNFNHNFGKIIKNGYINKFLG